MKMENERSQLCKQELYDPVTAFKSMDSFKHNKVVPFELRSYLQTHAKFICTDQQCQEAIQSLNKKILALEQSNFQELTLPSNIALRNISFGRYLNLQVKVGTMQQIYDIKLYTAKYISKFFIKEIQWCRELQLRKNYFVSTYGGDMYTLAQGLCKGLNNTKQNQNKNVFGYDQFYEFSRGFGFSFTAEEFVCIYKRTKSQTIRSPLAYDDPKSLLISIQDLSHIFLSAVTKTDIKKTIKLSTGIQVTKPEPSYKTASIRSRQQEKRINELHKNTQKFVFQESYDMNRDQRPIRTNYYYPEEHMQRNRQKYELREMNKQWNKECQKMGADEINIRYSIIDRKTYFY